MTSFESLSGRSTPTSPTASFIAYTIGSPTNSSRNQLTRSRNKPSYCQDLNIEIERHIEEEDEEKVEDNEEEEELNHVGPDEIISRLQKNVQILRKNVKNEISSWETQINSQLENEYITFAEAFMMTIEEIGTQKIYIPILNLDNGKKTSIHQHHNEIKEFKYTTDEEDLNSNEDEEKLSQALFDLYSICKSEGPLNAPFNERMGCFEVSRRFLFSYLKIDPECDYQNLLQKHISKAKIIHDRKMSTPSNSSELVVKEDEPFESWIQPRMQVYFQIYTKNPNGIELQNNRCYNCGAPIDSGNFNYKGLLRGARFCEYTGKYHCHSCHSNEVSVIPARILFDWNFDNYRVSNRAKQFIEVLWREPIFDVLALNKQLYEVKSLLKMKILRTQLHYARDFVYTCRYSDQMIKKKFGSRTHLVDFVDIYSIEDFMGVNDGSLITHLKLATSQIIDHILTCELCKSKGFICEFCHSKEILYPFQLRIVQQCPNCHSFFHKKCYIEKDCPKCMRIESYRLRTASHF